MDTGATWYSRVSRNLRSTSYSAAKPKPPWVCRQTLAASQDASAASSLAMLASAPHGLAGVEQPRSFVAHQVGRAHVGVGARDGKLDALILPDRPVEHDALVRVLAAPCR